MKKISCFLVFAFALCLSAASQKTASADAKLAQANEEIKATLISKVKLNEDAAANAVVIENEFYSKLAAIAALENASLKEKEAKRTEVHKTYRESLIALSLTPRQMEDVIDVITLVRFKHKL